MTAHDYVSDLQGLYSQVENRQKARIATAYQIGNVSVNQHRPWTQAQDLLRRHSAVDTTDPEKPRFLRGSQPLEELRILPEPSCYPTAVVL